MDTLSCQQTDPKLPCDSFTRHSNIFIFFKCLEFESAKSPSKEAASEHFLPSDGAFGEAAVPFAGQHGHVWRSKVGNSSQPYLQHPGR